VANSGSNNVSVLLNTGAGAFGPATNFAVGALPRSVAIGDLNGDGKLDLAVANSGSNNVSVLLNGATPAQSIQNLIALIISMGGQQNLIGPLNAASRVLLDDNPRNDIAACGALGAFINQVNAKGQRGQLGQLTPDQARQLREAANAIMDNLGCG